MKNIFFASLFMFFVQFANAQKTENIVLITDGEILQNDVDYCDIMLQNYKLQNVECHIISPKPNLSVSCPFTRGNTSKVIVYKKIEYGDASIRLHDTVDNSALSTWVNYFTFYFADSRQKKGGSQQSTLTKDPEAPYEQSPYSPTMNWDSGWGFQPLINNDTHFFTGIIVYSLFANTYTAWEYVNPKITNIDWQNYDYSSSETDDLNIQFKYEAIRYLAFAQPISNQQNLAFFNNFGFTNDDYINPACSPTAISSGAIPRIFSSAQAAIQNNTLCNPTGTNNISNPSGNIPTLCQSICSFYSSIKT